MENLHFCESYGIQQLDFVVANSSCAVLLKFVLHNAQLSCVLQGLLLRNFYRINGDLVDKA